MLRKPKLECVHPDSYKIAKIYDNDIFLYNRMVREWTIRKGNSLNYVNGFFMLIVCNVKKF